MDPVMNLVTNQAWDRTSTSAAGLAEPAGLVRDTQLHEHHALRRGRANAVLNQRTTTAWPPSARIDPRPIPSHQEAP